MEYLKRDPSGVPPEINMMLYRKLFPQPKGEGDALGHVEGDTDSTGDSGDSAAIDGGGDRPLGKGLIASLWPPKE